MAGAALMIGVLLVGVLMAGVMYIGALLMGVNATIEDGGGMDEDFGVAADF